jgi:hypothetical protein
LSNTGLLSNDERADVEHLKNCRLPAYLCKDCTRIYASLGVKL